MNKNTFTTVSLDKGIMHIYDFGAVKLHAYKTNDFIDDEVFILEKGGRAVILESPCFFDNNWELDAYIKKQQLSVSGMLLAYHMAGATFLPEVPKYATKNAEEYGHQSGGAALIQNFSQTFGEAFDASIHTITDYLVEGTVEIGGITFEIIPTPEAFDLNIPEIHAVYTHMLGHDCHSIVTNQSHAENMIAQLQGYQKSGVDLILTSHYTPEDQKDVAAKIAYLQELKTLAARCKTAEEFQSAMKQQYPNYQGENYLDMTVGFFFA